MNNQVATQRLKRQTSFIVAIPPFSWPFLFAPLEFFGRSMAFEMNVTSRQYENGNSQAPRVNGRSGTRCRVCTRKLGARTRFMGVIVEYTRLPGVIGVWEGCDWMKARCVYSPVRVARFGQESNPSGHMRKRDCQAEQDAGNG